MFGIYLKKIDILFLIGLRLIKNKDCTYAQMYQYGRNETVQYPSLLACHTCAILSKQKKSNPLLCRPAVLDCQKACYMFSLTLIIYSQFGIIKYVNFVTLKSVSRHDDVRIQSYLMTSVNIGCKRPICCTLIEKEETKLLGEIVFEPRYKHIESCLTMH